MTSDETLKAAAGEWLPDYPHDSIEMAAIKRWAKRGFISGARWQAEQAQQDESEAMQVAAQRAVRIRELEAKLDLAESNRRLAVERADDAWDVIKSDHWRERAEDAEAKLAKVRELHRPVEIEPSDTICGECSMLLPNGRYFGKVEEWPCPTLAILDGETDD